MTSTLAGDTVQLGGAQPATVVNVWATWCASCQEEMAALDSLEHEYASKGVRVIAVSVDEGETDKVRRFAESNHLRLPIAHDQAGSISAKYGVMGVPTTFIIDRNGTLTWRHTGNVVDVLADVRAALSRVSSGR